MKFRTKIVEVEARLVTSDNIDELMAWIGPAARKWSPVNPAYSAIIIATPDSSASGAKIGDYVVRDQTGAFSAMSKGLFEMKYEAVQ